jgi:hypothetical protein
MATLSLVLDKRRQKKDSTYPLVFQVVMNSVPVKISTGISVRECEFDSVNGIIKESSSVNKVEKTVKLTTQFQIKMTTYFGAN